MLIIFLFNNCVLHNKRYVLVTTAVSVISYYEKYYYFQSPQPKRPLYIPKYVINHGVVSGTTIQNMLKESKVLNRLFPNFKKNYKL